MMEDPSPFEPWSPSSSRKPALPYLAPRGRLPLWLPPLLCLSPRGCIWGFLMTTVRTTASKDLAH